MSNEPPNPSTAAPAAPTTFTAAAPIGVDLHAMINQAITASAPQPAPMDMAAVIAETVRATLASVAPAASPGKPIPPPTGYASAPVSVVPSDNPDNVMGWSQGQVDAYIDRHYPVPSMPWHAKNAAARKTLVQKVGLQLARTRIVFDPPRGGK